MLIMFQEKERILFWLSDAIPAVCPHAGSSDLPNSPEPSLSNLLTASKIKGAPMFPKESFCESLKEFVVDPDGGSVPVKLVHQTKSLGTSPFSFLHP